MEILDVRGLSCPLPVMRTQKALEKNQEGIHVVGTGNTAKNNVTRFATSKGYQVRVVREDRDEWELSITKG